MLRARPRAPSRRALVPAGAAPGRAPRPARRGRPSGGQVGVGRLAAGTPSSLLAAWASEVRRVGSAWAEKSEPARPRSAGAGPGAGAPGEGRAPGARLGHSLPAARTRGRGVVSGQRRAACRLRSRGPAAPPGIPGAPAAPPRPAARAPPLPSPRPRSLPGQRRGRGHRARDAGGPGPSGPRERPLGRGAGRPGGRGAEPTPNLLGCGAD